MLISDLLKKHGHNLTAVDRSAVENKINRIVAMRSKALAPALNEAAHEAVTNPSNCLLKFERIYSEEPVYLFGQDVPALAFTKISIFKAPASGDCEITEANHLISALVSEQVITSALLGTNQSRPKPLTLSRLFQHDLPKRAPIKTSAQTAYEHYMSEHLQSLALRTSKVSDQLKAGADKPSKALKDAASSLQYNIRDLILCDFGAQQVARNMSKTALQVETEASHAALNSSRFARISSPNLMRIADDAKNFVPEYERNHNPLIDAFHGRENATYCKALGALINAELVELSLTYPGLAEAQNYQVFRAIPEGTVSSIFSSNSTVPLEHAKSLRRLSADLYRLEQLDEPHEHAITEAGLNISRMNGTPWHINSATIGDSEGYYGIKISRVETNHSLGSHYIDTQGQPVIKVEITTDDLMLALRGHPAGRGIPATLNSFMFEKFHRQERDKSAFDIEVADLVDQVRNSPEAAAALTALSDLVNFLDGKGSGKAWKMRVETLFEAYIEAQERLQAKSSEATEIGCAVAAEIIRERIFKSLSSIQEHLPPGSLQLLLPK